MRALIMTVALVTVPVTGFAVDTYKIDPAHTFAHFAISHLGMATMRGRMDIIGGMFTLDPVAGTGTVKLTISAESIDTGYQRRDDDLRSPSFLNAIEFPELVYESTNATLPKDGSPGTVEGNLTLLGVTKPVTLEVSSMNCGANPFNKKPMCGFDAMTTIKRSNFGMKYAIPVIGDEMTLYFQVEGYKQ